MGAYKKTNKVPQSILDEIIDETFKKVNNNKDFDSELILELQKLNSEGNIFVGVEISDFLVNFRVCGG